MSEVGVLCAAVMVWKCLEDVTINRVAQQVDGNLHEGYTDSRT